MRIGFAGAGNMAAAMARGWAAAEGGPEVMSFTDAGSGSAAALAAEVGGEAVASNAELAEAADLVVLAMKPGQLGAVAEEISGAGKPVISILGATSVERLTEALGGLPVVRVMPNVAVEVRRGVLCYRASKAVEAEPRARIVELLGLLGTAIEVEDRLMDAATAVMGCSPAYVALVAEALTDAAVREGLPEERARQMVVETVAGTAALLEAHDTLSVRRMVTSPGGSTAAGLAALERGGVRAAMQDAVAASLERMRG